MVQFSCLAKNLFRLIVLVFDINFVATDFQPVASVHSSSSLLFGMHHQCVAPLAANSLHSGLFRASLIALRVCKSYIIN